jgi:hypothetical protein
MSVPEAFFFTWMAIEQLSLVNENVRVAAT